MYNFVTAPPSSHDAGGTTFSKLFGGGNTKTPTRPRTASSRSDETAAQEHGESIVSQDSTHLFAGLSPTQKGSVPRSFRNPGPFKRKPIPTFEPPTNLQVSPDRPPIGSKPPVSFGSPLSKRRGSWTRPFADGHPTIPPTSLSIRNHAAARESVASTAPYSNMISAMVSNREAGMNRPGTSGTGVIGAIGGHAHFPGMTGMPGPQSPTSEAITYQHIQEIASKRISTLDYLRKAHEGHVYWFNTLQFNKADLARMPCFDSRKLARRATNYLLLGLSLPAVIDLNGSNALEYLRALNVLLAEFDTFQQIHPPDGSTSSLSRARIPQMFKRATGTTSSKSRRTSSAAEIGLPYGSDAYDMKSSAGSLPSSLTSASVTSFLNGDSELLPGEEYAYLLTPSLPFEPDFYETFATLCDVLIDCYTKLMELVSSPKDCGPHIGEAFTKADGRVRKLIVHGIVKDFEDSSRTGVKSEVAGVGKVVLGGLM